MRSASMVAEVRSVLEINPDLEITPSARSRSSPPTAFCHTIRPTGLVVMAPTPASSQAAALLAGGVMIILPCVAAVQPPRAVETAAAHCESRAHLNPGL